MSEYDVMAEDQQRRNDTMTQERWWLCRRVSQVDPQQVCRHDGCGWVSVVVEIQKADGPEARRTEEES